jgi:hypothetical protein
MAGSFVRADKTSQDVPQWVRVDQTLLTAAILNLALDARNAMPNGGTHETRRLGNKGERETHAVGAALMMLIVGAIRPRFSGRDNGVASSQSGRTYR